MIEKLSLIHAIGEEVSRLSAGTVLLRQVENPNEMLPFGQRIGLKKFEEPQGIAAIAVTFLMMLPEIPIRMIGTMKIKPAQR